MFSHKPNLIASIEIARQAHVKALNEATRAIDEVFMRAMEKHYGPDFMQHVDECHMRIHPGYKYVGGLERSNATPQIRQLVRNSDNKVLAECRVSMYHDEIRVESETFE